MQISGKANTLIDKTGELIWYTPLFLVFLFSFIDVAVTSWDSSNYLKRALLFYQNGSLDWNFRPIFILMLGGLFKLFGPSLWSGVILIRLFYLLNVVLIFYFTKYLFNIKTAFIVSCLLMVSRYFNFISYRILLDNVHPFFVILAIFLSILSFEKSSLRLAISSGIIFTIATLIKVTTIIFIPFPFLVLIVNKNTRSINRNLVAMCLIYLAIAGSWFMYFYFFGSFPGQRTGKHMSSIFSLVADDPRIVNNVISAIITYWKRTIFHSDSLGYITAISWIYVFIRSIKNVRHRYLSCIFILFLPASIFLEMKKLRAGQAAIFILLSYVCIGDLIYFSINNFIKRYSKAFNPKYSTYFFNLLLLFIVIGFMTYQVFFAKYSSQSLLKDTILYKLIAGEKIYLHYKGHINNDTIEVAEKLKNHASTKDIIVSSRSLIRSLKFLMQDRYNLINLSSKGFKIHTLGTNIDQEIQNLKLNLDSQLMFLYNHIREDNLLRYNKKGLLILRYFTINRLKEKLNFADPYFLILDKNNRQRFLLELFNTDDISVLYESRSAMLIKVYPANLKLGSDFYLGKELGRLLKQLHNANPRNYEILKSELFSRVFKIPEYVIDKITHGSGSDLHSVSYSFYRFASNSLKSISSH